MGSKQEGILEVLQSDTERREWDEAIIEQITMIRRAPSNLEHHLKLGQLYLNVGMVGKALERFRHCAQSFYERNEYEEALGAAELILELQPDCQLAQRIVHNVKAKVAFVREMKSYPLIEALFASLPEDTLRELAARLQAISYPEGATVVKEGDLGFQLFLVRRGEAQVLRTDREGNRVRLAVFREGDFFGEISLLTGTPRTATVVATKPSEFWVLEKSDFDLFAAKYPLLKDVVHRCSRERMNDTARRVRAGEIENRVFPRIAVELEAQALLLGEDNRPKGMGILSSMIRDMSLCGAQLLIPLTYSRQWAELSQLQHARVAFALGPGLRLNLACYVEDAKQKKPGEQACVELRLSFGELDGEDKKKINDFVTRQFQGKQLVDQRPSSSSLPTPSGETKHDRNAHATMCST